MTPWAVTDISMDTLGAMTPLALVSDDQSQALDLAHLKQQVMESLPMPNDAVMAAELTRVLGSANIEAMLIASGGDVGSVVSDIVGKCGMSIKDAKTTSITIIEEAERRASEDADNTRPVRYTVDRYEGITAEELRAAQAQIDAELEALMNGLTPTDMTFDAESGLWAVQVGEGRVYIRSEAIVHYQVNEIALPSGESMFEITRRAAPVLAADGTLAYGDEGVAAAMADNDAFAGKSAVEVREMLFAMAGLFEELAAQEALTAEAANVAEQAQEVVMVDATAAAQDARLALVLNASSSVVAINQLRDVCGPAQDIDLWADDEAMIPPAHVIASMPSMSASRAI